jgi:rhodanese-related sulfurtransferase
MIPQIHPRDVKAKLDAGEPIVLLDVRQPNEHVYCHLADSEHIPLHELPTRWDELDVPADSLVVVYCHHGVRSLSGAAILMQAGIKNVASMSGGIEAWSLLVDPAVRRY